MELKDKEIAAIEERLRKIEGSCHSDIGVLNHIRKIRLILNKAKRRNGKL